MGAGGGGDHLRREEGWRAHVEQEEITALLIDRTRSGKRVVRLKGGDPFVFGRGGEEAEALAREKLPFEIIPGVSSVFAGPAYAGIPVTHREHNSQLTIFTGHEDPSKPAREGSTTPGLRVSQGQKSC